MGLGSKKVTTSHFFQNERQVKMKVAWENNSIVPSAKGTKSHSRHYVPQGRDAFGETYEHLMRIGVWNIQPLLRDANNERHKRNVEKLRKASQRLGKLKAIKQSGNLVVPFDKNQ